ncbi:MAG: GGDEF domain-containing protein [Ilumatobacter sp.]|nr:GGDEF domain-containing protein [Ilumatobacter sp.]
MSSVRVSQPDALNRLIAAADPSSKCDTGTAEQAARELLLVAQAEGDAELAAEAEVWICIHLLQAGRLREAIAESPSIRERLRAERPGTRLGDARLELLRTIALAASEAGEFDVAMGAAQELTRDPVVHAHADAAFDAAFSLAVCLERMGNSWQALRILTDVMAQHGTSAPSFPMLYTMNALVATALGAFHRVRDLDDEGESVDLLITARDAAERAMPLLEPFANPLYRVAVTGNLGEVLIYQGELDVAERHLRAALAEAERIGATAHRDRVRASLGAWMSAAGRDADALAWLTDLTTDLGEDGPHSTRIRAHHAAHLAARSLGRFEVALDHLEAYELLERRRTTSQLRSQSEMYVTRTEAQAEVERHRVSAERDPLTGLGNRRRLSRLLDQLAPVGRPATPFSVAMVDVDHFKSINDLLGHAVGDGVLVEVAQVLLDGSGDDEVIVRYGGEEIVIVMPSVDVDVATARCERLRERIERHAWLDLPEGRQLTVSIGVAGSPPSEPERAVAAADRAMYTAKRAGRNRVAVATSDDLRDATPMSIPRR